MFHEGSPRTRRWLVVPLCLVLATFVGCSKSVEDRLGEARLQQEVGSFKESIETLQSILDDVPDHPEANLLLGSAQVATGQPALAIWPLEVAGRSPEFADQADLALGAAYLSLEQRDSALQAADRVLARNADKPEVRQAAITIRASAHLGSGDWDAALEDVDRLLAMNPENADALALKAQALLSADRNKEAEAVLRQLWDSPTQGNTPAAARAGVALAKLEGYEYKDQAAAEEILQGLMERFPQNPSVLSFVTDFLRYTDRPEVAEKLLRDALERDPGDLRIRSTLADHLKETGDEKGAEALLVEATDLFDSPQAWVALADFYRSAGRYQESLKAFDRILELVPGASDTLRFRYADALIDAGELDRAAAEAQDIEGQSYRNVVLGRLALIHQDYPESLRLFDLALKEWPNNAGARYLAGRSALAMGNLDRGISELREASRVGIDETNAPIELGWIYLTLGNPSAAVTLETVALSDQDFQRGPRVGDATRILARANWMLGHKDTARGQVETLATIKGYQEIAVLERARFEAEDHGPAAAARFITDSKGLDLTDPEHDAALRKACDYLVAAEQGDEALRLAEAALDANPDLASAHDVVGRVLVAIGRSDEAAARFDRAVELDPNNAPALAGQASLRLAAGDADGARELFDRAAEADEVNASYPYQAAQIELAHGHTAEAEKRLEEALRRDPLHASANNDLAWILAERGESLDRALALATRASRADGSAAIFDTLGWVQYRRGAHEAAVKALAHAHELDPVSPSISYRLGLALVETGDRERAEALFREALAAGSFPEADAARTQLARLAEAS